MRRLLLLLAAVTTAAGLTACGGSDGGTGDASGTPSASASETSELENAYLHCKDKAVGNPLMAETDKVPAGTVITLATDSPVVDGAGDEYISGQATFCLLDWLDAPASVTSQVESTTALMGRQNASWEGYELTWSFHPDNGLDMVIAQSG